MKKTIGIVGNRAGDRMYFGAPITYLEYFNKFGNVRIIMPWEDKVDVDLLVLPGGADINPGHYREQPGYNTGSSDVFNEHFYLYKLPLYVEAKTPIFGICLGLQELGVFFGSKLTQDLPFHSQSPARWSAAHSVFKVGETNKKKAQLQVNSHHHQGIEAQNLSDQLVPLYYGEGLVEAFKHKDLPIVAVQWHPEELYDEVSHQFITDLLK